MNNEQITTTFSRDEFITLWNCVWSEISQREREYEMFHDQPLEFLLSELYKLEAKLKQLHTPTEGAR